jgi:hypothetical protein
LITAADSAEGNGVLDRLVPPAVTAGCCLTFSKGLCSPENRLMLIANNKAGSRLQLSLKILQLSVIKARPGRSLAFDCKKNFLYF